MTTPPPIRTTRAPVRTLVLSLAILVLLACLAAIVVTLVGNHRKTSRLQDAFALADSGTDDRMALALLRNCLKDDPHHEAAYVKLARVYERLGEWSKAAAAWQYASSLNAMRTDYVDARLLALFRAQSYEALASALDILQKRSPLPPKQAVLSGLAQVKTNRTDRARELLEALTGQEVLTSPEGQLLNLYVNARNIPRDELVSALTEITRAPEPAVAFDAMNALAGIALGAQDFAEAEKWLLAASAILPESGQILLGNLYFMRQDFDRALPLYEQILKRDSNPDIATRLGEIHASRNDRAALLALQEKYQVGNKQFLLAGYYLEALIAFMDRDDAKLADVLKRLNNIYNTPVAMLMTLYSGLQQNQVAEVTKALSLIEANFPGSAIQERAVGMALPFIANLTANQRLAEAAQIATIIRDEKNPVLLLEQVILTDKLRRRVLSSSEVTAALTRFPEDRQILYVAAEFALGQRDFTAARDRALASMRLGNETMDMALIYLSALEGLGANAELAAAFAQFRAQSPDSLALANAYLIYCRRHASPNELEALQREMTARPEPGFQAIALYAQAELAWQRQDLPAMTAALTKAMAVKPVSVQDFAEVEHAYRAAFLLAAADAIEPAIQLYEKIADYFSQKPLLLINLSELYAARGETDKALAAALNARQLMPTWPPANECYGIRLLEAKEFSRAAETLSPLVNHPERSDRVLSHWAEAMAGLIRTQFTAGQFELCLASCESLAKHVPDHPAIKEFSPKAQARTAPGP